MKLEFKKTVFAVAALTLILVSGFQNCAPNSQSKTASGLKPPVTDPFENLPGGTDPGTSGTGFPVTPTPTTQCPSTRPFNITATTVTTSVYDYSANYKIEVTCDCVA